MTTEQYEKPRAGVKARLRGWLGAAWRRLGRVFLARDFRVDRDAGGGWQLWLDYGAGFRPSGSFPTLTEAAAAGRRETRPARPGRELAGS
jgi:hypothetical protein